MQDFPLYFELGWQHILDWEGYDHILFVAALCGIYSLKDWRKVLILITAFTVGHTVTLALSVYDRIGIPAAITEFLIPVTIILTALYNIINREQRSAYFSFKYIMALLFGLIHGMGFSNYLKSLLGKSNNIVAELLAFNLGLEAGQVAIVVTVLLLTYAIIHLLKVPGAKWSLALSSVIFGVAFYMAAERLTSFIHQ